MRQKGEFGEDESNLKRYHGELLKRDGQREKKLKMY